MDKALPRNRGLDSRDIYEYLQREPKAITLPTEPPGDPPSDQLRQGGITEYVANVTEEVVPKELITTP